MDKFKHIDTWVFDLDNTLYNAHTGVFANLGDKITRYIVEHMSVTPAEANVIRKDYWKKYGTTLAGLMQEYNVDPNHFLDRTHDFDIRYVEKCAITQEYLAHLPGRKIVFTNAPRNFAKRMIAHLEIGHHFDDVFAVEDANYIPKPALQSFQTFIKKYQFDPTRACMFEDSHENLKTAAELGMTTVWFHGDEKPDTPHPHVHHAHTNLPEWLRHTLQKK